jgi:hypothetical protein
MVRFIPLEGTIMDQDAIHAHPINVIDGDFEVATGLRRAARGNVRDADRARDPLQRLAEAQLAGRMPLTEG